MQKFRIIKLILITLLITGFALCVSVIPAQADDIKVSPGSDKLIDVDDAAPGTSEIKEVKVTNESDQAKDLYLNIDDATDKDFADKIKFYVQDESSGKYFIGGIGDRMTLKEANNEGDMFIEELDPGESNRYDIKVKLDEDLGNEYQGKEVKFDIIFGFEQLAVASLTGETIPLIITPASVSEGEEEVAVGEETGIIGGEEVAGAEEALCESWPLWVWIVLLILYAVLFNFSSLRKIKEANKVKWFCQAICTIAILVVWYFFDKCRLYQWFPIVAVIIGIVSYWYYLHILRNSVRENNPEIKDTDQQ